MELLLCVKLADLDTKKSLNVQNLPTSFWDIQGCA